MGPLAAQVAREAAPELPLIFCMIQDPGQLGLLNVPNVSGVSFSIPVMNQLAAFRTVNPRGVRVGVIYGSEPVAKLVAEAQSRARVLRLNIVERRVASDKEVPEALRGLLKGSEAVDALWLPPDPMLLGDEARRFILAETLKAGKPVYAFSPRWWPRARWSATVPTYVSVGEQAAELVARAAGRRPRRGADGAARRAGDQQEVGRAPQAGDPGRRPWPAANKVRSESGAAMTRWA